MFDIIPAVIFLTAFIFRPVDSKPGLYDPNTDDVIVLTKKTFFNTILNSEIVWNVEFYNSWCGHCIHFAPTYKQLATELKGWRPVIGIAAIDCSSSENTEICRHYDIQGFPSMKLFPQHSTKDDQGIQYYNQNFHEIEAILVDFLTNLTIVGETPQNCPNLLPLKSVDHIWNEAKRDHKHLILIFEDFPSRLGREVILDMVAYKHFLVRRMTKGSVQKFRIKHFPSMYLFLQDGRIEQLAKGSSTRQEFVQALLDLDSADKEEVIGQSVHISDSKNEQNEQNQENTADVEEKISEDKLIDGTSHKRQAVYMQDLESALTYCFRQEIAIHKEIEEEDLAALKAFVRVLARYFPGREEVQGFLLKVNHWLDQVTSGLTGMHWVHNIDSIQTVDTFLPETIEWIGCRGSQPQYRGYPCGMWTLFHTLSVSAYEMGKDSPKFLYKEVLHAIQGYMKHFFGCAVCSSHFLKMAKSVDSDVSSPEESVLWLWRAHNKANKRLHGDQSEDPQNLKVQFPPKSLCSDCQTDSSNPSSPKWNENHVLSFLTKFYRKENIIQIMSNQSFDPGSYQAKTRNDMDWWERQQRRKDLEKIALLRQQKKDKNQQKWKALAVANQENQPKEKTLKREIVMAINNRSWLNGMDMGLCAMFYFLCLIIILLLYYHFMVKKKWKYCGKLF